MHVKIGASPEHKYSIKIKTGKTLNEYDLFENNTSFIRCHMLPYIGYCFVPHVRKVNILTS